MKTNPFNIAACLGVAAGLGTIMLSPVQGIEAPVDDAPPPPAVAGAAEANEPAPAEAAEEEAKAAYLGVVTAPVPEILAEHLNLKPGEGVLVRSVMPDGPADKAGIAPNDIITRFAGEPVGSVQELSTLVASQSPEDPVKLDLIHKGKDKKIEATLGTRPKDISARGLAPQPLDNLHLEGLPNDLADRVRGMIEGNLGELQMDLENGMIEQMPRMDEAMRELRKRMENAMEDLDAGIPKAAAEMAATIRVMDEQGSVELKSNQDGKEVTVRDADNKITWTGPWDTEQDKAAAPDNVRERVERLNIDQAGANGIRLRMGGGFQFPQRQKE